MSVERKKIGILADEDTILGFQLCGIEESKNIPNIIAVTTETSEDDLEDHFRTLIQNKEICILLVSDFVAIKIEKILQTKVDNMPYVMEIPSKYRSSDN